MTVEEMHNLIESMMDDSKSQKYVFQKRFYPSHGVKRMNEQWKQIRRVSEAIHSAMPKVDYKELRSCAVKGIPVKQRSVIRQALNNIEINEIVWLKPARKGEG